MLTAIVTDAFAGLPIRALAIPDRVSSIEANAFRGYILLENIQFGENSELTAIMTDAFAGLPISDFVIPDLVSSIEPNAFR